MIPAIATNIMTTPMTMNDACKPNIAELTPNQSTPIISHNFPTNSPTHVIVPSS